MTFLDASVTTALLLLFSWFSPTFGQLCEYGLTPPPPGSATSRATFKPPQRNWRTKTQNKQVDPPPMKVRPLIVNGLSGNRVDLVFFGDGYTADEETKFFEDALRLAKNITEEHTYEVVLPALNFWAAFTPSNESGIGVDGKPKDTVYGLYRIGTELRGVYYDKPEIAEAACGSLGSQCDYPILLANDPYYGGLGGDFTVITASFLNGPLVLRHELGHSIIDVGDEYDGSYAYFGANSAPDSHSVGWKHWLDSSPPNPRAQRSHMPMQLYPWVLLNTSISYKIPFESGGGYERYLVKFSLSGIPEAGDAQVLLDGNVLDWKVESMAGLDRWHYDIFVDEPLPAGDHELEFSLLNEEREGFAQLGSAEVLEYGQETEFVTEPGYYGVFPTYSDVNETTYRPTNSDCLMRRVTSVGFCKVCIEALWLQILKPLSYIDSVQQSCRRKHIQVDLTLLALAQFRTYGGSHLDERYTITWRREDGGVIRSAQDQTRLSVPARWYSGTSVEVEIAFSTTQVRVDQEGVLVKKGLITLQDCDESRDAY